MPFAADWSNSIIVDHTKLNAVATGMRAIRTAISDRLATLISGFTAGETVLGILKLPFIASSTPGTVTDQIQLYGKVVSTKTELHILDEDGTERAMTAGGKLNAAIFGGVYAAPASVADLVNIMGYIYPIGSVVTLGVSTNPGTLFGVGTWTAIAGKVIVGLDSGDTDFDVLSETGGAKTVTLDTTMIPSHTHSYDRAGNGSGGGVSPDGSGTGNVSTTSGATGGGAAHNNLQPYIVKYVWQRTS